LLYYYKKRHELAHELKKPETQNLAMFQQRHDAAKQLYTMKNKEVVEQLQAIYKTRNVQSEVRTFIVAQANFFGGASNTYSHLAAKLSAVVSDEPLQYHFTTPTPTPTPTSTSTSTPISTPKPTPTLIPTPTPTPTPISTPIPTSISTPPLIPTIPTTPAPHLQPANSLGSEPSSLSPAVGVKKAKALYKFTGEIPTELSFNAGDIITIHNSSHPDWWQGELNGRHGELPANYVQLL